MTVKARLCRDYFTFIIDPIWSNISTSAFLSNLPKMIEGMIFLYNNNSMLYRPFLFNNITTR